MPTLMWAIVLVAIFGFGLFTGKLMAEQIEAIDMKRVEAIRATGFIGEE